MRLSFTVEAAEDTENYKFSAKSPGFKGDFAFQVFVRRVMTTAVVLPLRWTKKPMPLFPRVRTGQKTNMRYTLPSQSKI